MNFLVISASASELKCERRTGKKKDNEDIQFNNYCFAADLFMFPDRIKRNFFSGSGGNCKVDLFAGFWRNV